MSSEENNNNSLLNKTIIEEICGFHYFPNEIYIVAVGIFILVTVLIGLLFIFTRDIIGMNDYIFVLFGLAEFFIPLYISYNYVYKSGLKNSKDLINKYKSLNL